MKFCPLCENMLYVSDGTSEGVGFKCRKCDYVEKITAENPIVYEHNLRGDTASKIIVNPYLTQDPTLPRFTSVKCPTAGCPSDDVVGVKVDSTNVVWMYQCAICKVSWKQSSRLS